VFILSAWHPCHFNHAIMQLVSPLLELSECLNFVIG
jgi:hypothetical protein